MTSLKSSEASFGRKTTHLGGVGIPGRHQWKVSESTSKLHRERKSSEPESSLRDSIEISLDLGE